MTEPHGRPDQQPPRSVRMPGCRPRPRQPRSNRPAPRLLQVREPPAPKRSPWSRTALITAILLLLVLASQALGDALRKPHQREDEGPALPTFAPTASGTPWTPLPTVTPTATPALREAWGPWSGRRRPASCGRICGRPRVVGSRRLSVRKLRGGRGRDPGRADGRRQRVRRDGDPRARPATGQQLWRLDRDQPLCARRLREPCSSARASTNAMSGPKLGTEWGRRDDRTEYRPRNGLGPVLGLADTHRRGTPTCVSGAAAACRRTRS